MKKWIRWEGLGLFIGVVVLFCIFWFLFIDGIVKSMIEKYGSQAIGAKVELGSADLSLFPAGLELKDLQITNPDDPMKNAVFQGQNVKANLVTAFRSASFSIKTKDLALALRRALEEK